MRLRAKIAEDELRSLKKAPSEGGSAGNVGQAQLMSMREVVQGNTAGRVELQEIDESLPTDSNSSGNQQRQLREEVSRLRKLIKEHNRHIREGKQYILNLEQAVAQDEQAVAQDKAGGGGGMAADEAADVREEIRRMIDRLQANA